MLQGLITVLVDATLVALSAEAMIVGAGLALRLPLLVDVVVVVMLVMLVLVRWSGWIVDWLMAWFKLFEGRCVLLGCRSEGWMLLWLAAWFRLFDGRVGRLILGLWRMRWGSLG